MDDLLKTIYYNPKTGFQNADRLYKKAKEIDDKITVKFVKEWLNKQSTAQITKEVKQTKIQYSTIQSRGLKNNYQMDLFILPYPKQNENYKYLLTCIDVYSRFVFVKLLKTKTGPEVFDKIKEMFKDNGKCVNLNLDEGSEFIYKPFQDYCEKNKITLWFSNPEEDNKNAIIERWHRTLRNLILKYTITNSRKYIGVLSDLIENYNTSFHRTIKTSPNKIWNKEAVNQQEIKVMNYNFVIGDKVRHKTDKTTFAKSSSTSTYTKKIYTITKIEGQGYYLDSLKKLFKGHELVRAIDDSINEDEGDIENEQIEKENRVQRRLNKEGIKDYLGAGKYYK